MRAIVTAVGKIVQRERFILPFLVLFFLLLLRNPFSQRTLIPNLEPYPDSIHYIDSAFSFLAGKGFVIEREGRSIDPSVPPLYSLVLAPLFVLIPDVRAFYFTNVFLALASFVLFYAITKKLFVQKPIQILVLLLYVTSYPLNWFPTLAMAENLLLFLFLSSVYLLVSKVKPLFIVLAGLIAVAFYATKYASLPLSVSFTFLYGLKLLFHETEVKGKKHSLTFWQRQKTNSRLLMYYVASLGVFGAILVLYEYLAEGQTVISRLWNIVDYVFFPKPAVREVAPEAVAQTAPTSGNVFFATTYVASNVDYYLKWLIGESRIVLWKPITILPRILAIPALIGLFASLVHKQTRFIAFSFVTMLASVVAFMSVFYYHDGRYFFVAIPGLFLGLGFFFHFLMTVFPQKKRLVSFIVLAVSVFYMLANLSQLKFSIMLNLRHSETPWYYVSVRFIDQYMHDHATEFTKTPVVISSLPPYLIDAYAKEPMILIPLNKDQEFRSYAKEAWGDINVQDLPSVYALYLKNGHRVFVMEYGLGNETYLHESFDSLLKDFRNQKVFSGCHDLCDIYELSLPVAFLQGGK